MKPRLVEQKIFISSPEPGTTVSGGSYYTKRDGVEMMSLHTYSSRSDVLSHDFYRFSDDNGQNWSDPVLVPAEEQTESGIRRRHARGGYLDPTSGRFLKIRNEAVLPNDKVSEFMTHNAVFIALSLDGGRTHVYDGPLVADGPEFNPKHPLPNVTVGKNCFMLGDSTCMPITLPDGTLLQPVQLSPAGADGMNANPGAGFTYTDCAVIRGTWREDATISWRLGGMVVADPKRSTRGLIEPTIARLRDGRILMVMRGSNDALPSLPGHRWYSISEDDGESWSTAEPWMYTSGVTFFSPSSCSQLVSHSNGEIYWIGNICKENPQGNAPRFPITIGQVDPERGTLIEESVLNIDDRKPGDGKFLTLSNFYAREDRERGTIVLHLCRNSRTDQRDRSDHAGFQGDCMMYHIAVD
jgi:hypothetical protein